MVIEFKAKVRNDGAINLRKKNNAILGIRPGSTVSVRIDTAAGAARLTPLGYTCTVCKKNVSSPLDGIGICKSCNNQIVSLLKEGLYKDVADAMAKVRDQNKPKVVNRK